MVLDRDKLRSPTRTAASRTVTVSSTGASSTGAVSVIVVAFNSADVIVEALASAKLHLPLAELLVVDNDSHDDTVALAEKLGARVIPTGGNQGFGAAVNIGVRCAGGEACVILNPDARIVSADLDELSAIEPLGLLAFWERETVGATASVSALTKPELYWPVEVLWTLANWLLVPREVDFRRPRLGRRERLHGACFMVRTDEFLRLGGFDERLFLYYEDNLLTRTYRAAGLPLRHSDGLIAEHAGSGSSPRLHERVVAWAILSNVEGIAIESGSHKAAAASRLYVWNLRLISGIGRIVRSWPFVGRRASKKQEQARQILAHLLSESSAPPRAGAYPVASQTMLSALAKRVDPS